MYIPSWEIHVHTQYCIRYSIHRFNRSKTVNYRTVQLGRNTFIFLIFTKHNIIINYICIFTMSSFTSIFVILCLDLLFNKQELKHVLELYLIDNMVFNMIIYFIMYLTVTVLFVDQSVLYFVPNQHSYP